MRPTRGVTLAGLVLVAVAAPAGAFALTGSGDSGTPPPAAHPDSTTAANTEADDPATEPAETESDAPEGTDPTEGTDGTAQAAAASAAGRAHAAAMKAWAHCVGEAASGPKTGERTGPPKLACGVKPVGPGRAAHAPDSAGSPQGSAPGKSHPHGRSGAHRH